MGLKKNVSFSFTESEQFGDSGPGSKPSNIPSTSKSSGDQQETDLSQTHRVQVADDIKSDTRASPPYQGLELPGNAMLSSPPVSPNSSPAHRLQHAKVVSDVENLDDIPMITLNRYSEPRTVSPFDDSSDEEDEGITIGASKKPQPHSKAREGVHQAEKLVGAIKSGALLPNEFEKAPTGATSSNPGPAEDYDDKKGYVQTNQRYIPGIMRLLMSLSRRQTTSDQTPSASARSSISVTGSNTPRKWFSKSPWGSMTSMAHLLGASTVLGSNAAPKVQTKPERPALPRSHSSGFIQAFHKIGLRSSLDPQEATIAIQLDDVRARQKYIINLCRAMMENGAPTHRLEEMMKTTAKYLELSAQFMYLPGCMLMSFDDHEVQQSNIRLVKVDQGVNLEKLEDVHNIYKKVNYGELGFKDAAESLEEIREAAPRYGPWFLVLIYGLASMTVGPFAFQARLIDLPISFVLGCLLGWLALIQAPKTEVYSNVFEVLAAVLTSMAARAIGSIRRNGTEVFCFSAIAQSSIALILPGYTILCGSLELQAHNLVTGSVRIVYAIITALLLGFGITVGTAFIGFWHGATDSITCPPSFDLWEKRPEFSHFPFAFLFTICLIVINQAKWRQAPAMATISMIGYGVNFAFSKYLASNLQVANGLAALAIGVCAGLYSRVLQGVAAAVILPAIFVQVPSGLAAGGSLVSGITSANQITRNATGISVVNNGTSGFQAAQNASVRETASSASQMYGGTIFNVGYGMAQIAIGISVGLFMGTLLVYPFGKKGQKSVLFTF